MKIKQVSKLTGLTEKTIRYYESKGFITPDIHELNGRSFRDYDKEHISMLSAVSILRKARFTIEQIKAMQKQPEQIAEILNGYITNIDKAIAILEMIKTLFESVDIASFNDIYELAAYLEDAARDIKLPASDYNFRFKRLDNDYIQKKNRILTSPPLMFRFGWLDLYRGHDYDRYQDIRSKLNAAGLFFKATEYTATTRLSIQGLANQGSAFQYNRGPSITPMGIQARALSDKSLDMYYIEVRKKDAEKAREALRIIN